MRKINDMTELTARYPEASPASISKVSDHLTPLYRKWVEAARFCVLSTVGQGGVHGSPRGDDGPVIRVADERTLLMPDWRGNNRLDCLRDIVEDGRVALLFMVPGSNSTLRVNGHAYLTDDQAMRESFARKSILPATVIVFEIAEIYTQCAKALMRAGLWTRDDRDTVPTMGEILADMSKGEYGGPDYDKGYDDYAKTRMW